MCDYCSVGHVFQIGGKGKKGKQSSKTKQPAPQLIISDSEDLNAEGRHSVSMIVLFFTEIQCTLENLSTRTSFRGQ